MCIRRDRVPCPILALDRREGASCDLCPPRLPSRRPTLREIERRFLCLPPPPGALEGAERTEIVQGYLTDGDPAVRIRRSRRVGPDGDEERWTLTVKSGAGRIREEVEADLEAEAGEALLRMAGERRVEKVRYRADRWEIDVLGGAFEGAVAAEVELERADEPLPPPPPGLRLGPEVTEEGRWTNQALAHLAPGAARERVEEARARVEEADPWTP